MSQLTNHLQIYKLLPGTNCRACGLATCLAFAVAVMRGEKQPGQCPYWQGEASLEIGATKPQGPSAEEEMRLALEGLRKKVREKDLASLAQRLGGRMHQEKLVLRCLGKDFRVDQEGIITSDCHVNLWLTWPILQYILECQGVPPQERWVPLRDLPGGGDWWRLFEQRCEKPLKKVIDGYTQLMEDLVELFDGQRAPASFDSDIAVVLKPLPMFPLLLCYWKADEAMDSSMHLFFDTTAHYNLGIESVYRLSAGLVTMFEKIAQTHGG